jgi:hypothetical protein
MAAATLASPPLTMALAMGLLPAVPPALRAMLLPVPPVPPRVVEGPRARGLHSSTSQLNLSRF